MLSTLEGTWSEDHEITHSGTITVTGGILAEIGNLSRLEILYIGSSYLTGEIPSSIFNMSSLTYLSFCRNSLSGTIWYDPNPREADGRRDGDARAHAAGHFDVSRRRGIGSKGQIEEQSYQEGASEKERPSTCQVSRLRPILEIYLFWFVFELFLVYFLILQNYLLLW